MSDWLVDRVSIDALKAGTKPAVERLGELHLHYNLYVQQGLGVIWSKLVGEKDRNWGQLMIGQNGILIYEYVGQAMFEVFFLPFDEMGIVNLDRADDEGILVESTGDTVRFRTNHPRELVVARIRDAKRAALQR